ncbi:MAG TPA: helix-turn-helix transcriptional regulator [Gammaproteobacteria bacterium]
MRSSDLQFLFTLWQELADAPAAESDAALHHAMEKLSGHIGARNILWVAGRLYPERKVEHPMLGWVIQDVAYLHDGERLLGLAGEVVSRINEGEEDRSAIAAARLAGRTWSHLRHELVDDEAWRNCWVVNDVLATERIGDRLSGSHSLPGCESHFVLERSRDERPFGPRERDLLHYFLLGSTTFQRELMLSRGLLDAAYPLSARERDVLKLLLTDASEKEIAQQLGIGYRTVHQHAQSIYQKLGVRGRWGLMAKWLRHEV